MAGKAPGSDEDGVAAQCEAGGPWVAREPYAGGARDSPPFGRGDRFRGLVEAAAGFHLDEGDGVAPPHDKIDFATYRRARIE